jgi:hypothetical protein
MMSTFGKHAPRMMDWMGKNMLIHDQLRDEPARDREGSLHRPGRDGKVRGDHPGYVTKTSLYTRASMHPLLTTAAVAAVGVVAAALLAPPKTRMERLADYWKR